MRRAPGVQPGGKGERASISRDGKEERQRQQQAYKPGSHIAFLPFLFIKRALGVISCILFFICVQRVIQSLRCRPAHAGHAG